MHMLEERQRYRMVQAAHHREDCAQSLSGNHREHQTNRRTMTPTEIQKAANARKTSMRKILRAANVAASTWWRWKNGKHSPSLKTVTRIVDAVKGGAA
jgi:hypothetical protein